MTQTITRVPALASPITPDLLEQAGYSVSVEVRNQVVPIPTGGVQVALFPAGPRSGTMGLLFKDRASAYAAFVAHQAAATFTLTDTDVPQATMTYAVAGQLGLALAEGDDDTWRVSVGFQELA